MISRISSLFAFLFFVATACDWVNTVMFEEFILKASDAKGPFEGMEAKESDR